MARTAPVPKARANLSPSTCLPCRPGPPARGPASQFRRLARFMDRASTIQSDEPFHFANLRNQFADFPYLHCSIDQRLLTLETCCGYEYGWDRVHALPRLFKGLPERTGRLKGSAALPRNPPHLRVILFRGLLLCQKEKRTLPGARATVTWFERVTAQHRVRTIGILTDCPFGRWRDKPRLLNPIRNTLGPSHSRPNDVRVKPFSTSVFKVFI